MAIASDTSNRPQNDVGNSLGLSIRLLRNGGFLRRGHVAGGLDHRPVLRGGSGAEMGTLRAPRLNKCFFGIYREIHNSDTNLDARLRA